LKQRKSHIICSWLLLGFFVAGQFVLYAHWHKVNTQPVKERLQTSQQKVSEKCRLCDVMHFNAMAINAHHSVIPVAITHHDYIAITYSFLSISPVLSSGRAPPAS